MDGFFSNIIPLFIVISVIFSIINNAKKANEKYKKTQSSSTPSKNSGYQTLQEIIRQQIAEQRAGTQQQYTPQPVVASPEKQPERTSSLESVPVEMQRHSHNVHPYGAYNEGDSLNRNSLENIPTEMQGYQASGYSEGQSLEGEFLGLSSYEMADDIEDGLYVGKVERRRRKPTAMRLSGGDYKALKLNRETIVTGVILSEILNKRGGRRAS